MERFNRAKREKVSNQLEPQSRDMNGLYQVRSELPLLHLTHVFTYASCFDRSGFHCRSLCVATIRVSPKTNLKLPVSSRLLAWRRLPRQLSVHPSFLFTFLWRNKVIFSPSCAKRSESPQHRLAEASIQRPFLFLLPLFDCSSSLPRR